MWKEVCHKENTSDITSLIARFMGPTWGPSGADRTQVGPMLAPWTLLSRLSLHKLPINTNTILLNFFIITCSHHRCKIGLTDRGDVFPSIIIDKIDLTLIILLCSMKYTCTVTYPSEKRYFQPGIKPGLRVIHNPIAIIKINKVDISENLEVKFNDNTWFKHNREVWGKTHKIRQRFGFRFLCVVA